MNNLFMWEYNGETEIGVCVNKYCATGKREFRWLNGAITRWENSITDLRPAKVVGADAVVIEKNTFADILGLINEAHSYPDGDLKRIAMRIREALNTTPPITEPKNFGAIVEATIEGWEAHASPRKTFIRLMGGWFCEFTKKYYNWSDLINPVVSEGVRE